MEYKEKRKAARRQQVLRRRFESIELINNIKSNACSDCGNKFHNCQMDFVNKSGKSQRISRLLLKSKNRIMNELQSKDLVCANCGRLRIWKQRRQNRASAT
jgi:hypothetical protein